MTPISIDDRTEWLERVVLHAGRDASSPRPVDAGFDRFAGELEWYAEALRAARTAGVPY